MNKTLTNCAPLIKTRKFYEIKYSQTPFRHLYIYSKHCNHIYTEFALAIVYFKTIQFL